MDRDLLASLPPVQRLALAYAPRRAQPAWLALLALDSRLALLLRQSRQPMLTQMRLAWWRDRLAEPLSAWPRGEPLLGALTAWAGQHGALRGLVDGWELLLGDTPLSAESLADFAAARAGAMRALAALLGYADHAAAAYHAGEGWAATDLAAHLSQPEEQAAVAALIERQDWRVPALPRALRPLAVLQGLGRRGLLGAPGSYAQFLMVLRLGMWGR